MLRPSPRRTKLTWSLASGNGINLGFLPHGTILTWIYAPLDDAPHPQVHPKCAQEHRKRPPSGPKSIPIAPRQVLRVPQGNPNLFCITLRDICMSWKIQLRRNVVADLFFRMSWTNPLRRSEVAEFVSSRSSGNKQIACRGKISFVVTQ